MMKAFVSAAVSLIALQPTVGWTQPALAGSAKQEEAGITDIVVTAQRRSERLQDVPITIAAFTGDRLQKAAIQTTSELAMITPGLIVGNTSGFVRPSIRGVGTTSAGAGLENSIATYIDNVYIASQPAALLSLSDVERVEVLKGPQGTLFGRNAAGGVIQVVTRTPSMTPSGSAALNYGNYDSLRAEAYLTGPLSDSVAASLAATAARHDPFGLNIPTNTGVRNTKSDIATRLKLHWEGDAVNLDLSADYSRLNGTEVLVSAPREGSRQFATPFLGDDYDTDFNTEPTRLVTGVGGSGKVASDFGSVTLSSITAYRTLKFDQTLDGDVGPAPILVQDYLQKDRQFSQELQLSSNGDGQLTWQLGAYYFKLNARYDPYDLIQAAGRSNTLSRQQAKSVAGFAQTTWTVTGSTRITAGLRLTDETKQVSGTTRTTNNAGALLSTAGPFAQENHYKPLTWRLAVDQRFSPEVMGYASYSRGFKSGGFNAQTPAAIGYNPERLDAYEIGLKTDLFDRKVRFNVSTFYYSFKNMQVSTYIVASFSQIYNGARSKIYGLDLDLEVHPTRALTLTASFEGLHDRFKSFPAAVISRPNPATGGYILAPGTAKGNRLPYAADITFNLGADYELPTAFGSAGVNVTYAYNDGYFTEPDNRLRQPSYSMLNATVRIAGEDDHWSLKLWGRNLLNAAVRLQYLTSGITEGVSFAPPRTYGITVGAKF